MSNINHVSTASELLKMYWKLSKNQDMKPDQELLRKWNFSQTQWHCFASLIEDLELNENGVEILLEEIKSGRAVLPCDQ